MLADLILVLPPPPSLPCSLPSCPPLNVQGTTRPNPDLVLPSGWLAGPLYPYLCTVTTSKHNPSTIPTATIPTPAAPTYLRAQSLPLCAIPTTAAPTYLHAQSLPPQPPPTSMHNPHHRSPYLPPCTIPTTAAPTYLHAQSPPPQPLPTSMHNPHHRSPYLPPCTILRACRYSMPLQMSMSTGASADMMPLPDESYISFFTACRKVPRLASHNSCRDRQ